MGQKSWTLDKYGASHLGSHSRTFLTVDELPGDGNSIPAAYRWEGQHGSQPTTIFRSTDTFPTRNSAQTKALEWATLGTGKWERVAR
jgi:hypothetical protein